MTTFDFRRPVGQSSTASKTVLSVVRILIASYFLASATGLVFEPAARTFLDAILPTDAAQVATTVYLFVTAFAVMIGVALRPAALLLAVYIFWSGFTHYQMGGGQAELSAYWRDMALLGAILLIAATEPGARAKFLFWKLPVRRTSSKALESFLAEDTKGDDDNLFADLWDSSGARPKSASA